MAKKKRKGFTSVKYKGHTIRFQKQTAGVFAKASSLTRQFIGFGKNKTQALKHAKKSIDHLTKKRRRKRK